MIQSSSFRNVVSRNHFTIEVPNAKVSVIRSKLMKGSVRSNSIYNIIRLYVFIEKMNSMSITHVPKEDMAEMVYSGHFDRVTKALHILEQVGLVCIEDYTDKTDGRYYKYHAKRVYYKKKKDDGTRIFEYNLPLFTNNLFISFAQGKQGVTNQSKKQFDIGLTIDTSNVLKESSPARVEVCQDKNDEIFKTLFTSWYHELDINGIHTEGHFSERDGRFYHMFHDMKKDERNQVRWDGEQVTEVWDAHCAFMAVLCYYLKNYKKYDSEDEKKAFIEEANRMLNYIVEKDFYDYIATSYYDFGDKKTGRERTKKLLNSYKSISRKGYFKKDGQLKDIWWARQFGGLDLFFKEYFPHMRDFFLDYSRRYEEREFRGTLMLHKVSNIQHDIMPYEFKLIALGVCQDLYNKYGIKSITVHDAVYLKESDKKRLDETEGSANTTVAYLYAIRLGLGLKAKPLF